MSLKYLYVNMILTNVHVKLLSTELKGKAFD